MRGALLIADKSMETNLEAEVGFRKTSGPLDDPRGTQSRLAGNQPPEFAPRSLDGYLFSLLRYGRHRDVAGFFARAAGQS